ncbi:hypothetical protein PAXINDRAFT_102246 [Paxillus involutus ATCC 200175]|uniref:Protein kinase domain-containing protein n=1 Tax=Paxillus involutus ATCC 200175 TaxID=664439 RepID=A0A0C9TQI8_PAXIN|nr:hypothetical protein PAXINDRAFT_102246 [Paxillus involutus ATCC 200175]
MSTSRLYAALWINGSHVATGREMLGFFASYRRPLLWFYWPSFGSSTTATSEEEAKLARKVDDQPSRAFEWEKKDLVLGDDEDDEGHVIVHSHKEQSCPSELPIDLTFRLSRQSIYPVAYGWRSDIWKCTVKQDAQSSEVAVKSIRSHDLGAEDIYNKNEQLRPALKLRARLKHENILPILGVATGFGRFTALVYPWVENGTLASYLQRNREQLSFRDRLELLRDAAAGLCYLHSCSIVHGQLTGSNIFVSADGRAQLSGFGFSNIILEFLGKSHSSSSMNGIVRWAAPEILTTHDDESSSWAPTEQSDVYSFGSVMLQVCSGEVPYANLRSDVQVLLALAKGATPSRPTTPWMNDRVWDFIQRCWLAEEQGAERPSAEEALNFIQEEISLLCPIF